MNERIQELAEQAGFTVENGHIQSLAYKQTEKFAELIVKECIVTIQRGITRDGHQTEKYIRSMAHIKDIKQHFGVEE